MKNYRLFEALIQHEKTAPFSIAAKALLADLKLDIPPLKGAKADVGHEFFDIDQEKFLERNAHTLSLAAKEESAIVCIEHSSLLSLALTKDILSHDQAFFERIAQRFLSKNISLNVDVEIIALEQFLIENVGVEALQQAVQKTFSTFKAGLFQSNTSCRSRKYADLDTFSTLLDAISLPCVAHESMVESDGFEVFDVAPHLAKQLASKVLLDLFDNAADFVVVSDARSFIMFDHYQKECEKVAGRDIGLGILTLPELLLLALGQTDKKRIGLDQHKSSVTLI